jgi:thioredoxin-related protein
MRCLDALGVKQSGRFGENRLLECQSVLEDLGLARELKAPGTPAFYLASPSGEISRWPGYQALEQFLRWRFDLR